MISPGILVNLYTTVEWPVLSCSPVYQYWTAQVSSSSAPDSFPALYRNLDSLERSGKYVSYWEWPMEYQFNGFLLIQWWSWSVLTKGACGSVHSAILPGVYDVYVISFGQVLSLPATSNHTVPAGLVKNTGSCRESDAGTFLMVWQNTWTPKTAFGLRQAKENKTPKEILKPQHNAQLLEAEHEKPVKICINCRPSDSRPRSRCQSISSGSWHPRRWSNPICWGQFDWSLLRRLS